jgi:dTDP-4-dehydrorhamnose 3,5-epimerase/CDP-3, 6-dideoxy-D-glycero-D-glycero-4-hexulose-5-epimerase
MNIIETDFQSLLILELSSFKDNRGEFVKTIHSDTFEKHGLDWHFSESFYSVSKRNVIRGMHFQLPPADHAKLVYVISGKIIDVVLDLRKDSGTYGNYYSIELSAENRKAIYIDKGFAHGFIAMEDDSIVEYHTTTSQNRECEAGILWNSFGYDWTGIEKPIISERDRSFCSLSQFQSPF